MHGCPLVFLFTHIKGMYSAHVDLCYKARLSSLSKSFQAALDQCADIHGSMAGRCLKAGRLWASQKRTALILNIHFNIWTVDGEPLKTPCYTNRFCSFLYVQLITICYASTNVFFGHNSFIVYQFVQMHQAHRAVVLIYRDFVKNKTVKRV